MCKFLSLLIVSFKPYFVLLRNVIYYPTKGVPWGFSPEPLKSRLVPLVIRELQQLEGRALHELGLLSLLVRKVVPSRTTTSPLGSSWNVWVHFAALGIASRVL